MTDHSPIKMAGIRGMIARKMRSSLDTAAQLSFHSTFKVDHLVKRRADLKPQGITYEDMVIKAVSEVLSELPVFNGLFNGDIYTPLSVHNVSVAIALDGSLVAPAIMGAETMGLSDISAARRDLTQRARSGKLTVEEMKGGTFTVSNLGIYPVDHFTPIINLPQVAILGIGQLKKTVSLSEEGTLESAHEMGVSLTVDHRVIDGAPCGDFMARLRRKLGSV